MLGIAADIVLHLRARRRAKRVSDTDRAQSIAERERRRAARERSGLNAMQQRLVTRPTLGARRAIIIDPADDMFAIVMMQTPSQRGRIQQELKALIYQAMGR